jgi:hypothetical protein
MDTQTPPLAKQFEIPAEVRAFIESLLTDAGMPDIDETMREEMVKEIYARLDNYLTSVIIDNMPPEHLEEFTKMNEEGRTREEIERFTKEKMPNCEQVFAQAFSDFRQLYLGQKVFEKTGASGTETGQSPTGGSSGPN